MSSVTNAPAKDLPPNKCLKSSAPTHYFADIDGKCYMVKKSVLNRDKLAFEALQTEEEKLEYFRQHADIIRENFDPEGQMFLNTVYKDS